MERPTMQIHDEFNRSFILVIRFWGVGCSFVKNAILYIDCYSIDKKVYRRKKKILKRIVGIKLILTFVD
jgi:hypothetical protein